MAQRPSEEAQGDASPAAERRGKEGPRGSRGRPRLTDSDRARRRLESRKKYDVRRVYLGEAHELWSDVRGSTRMSDAALAHYLLLLHHAHAGAGPGGQNQNQNQNPRDGGKKTGPQVSAKQKGGSKPPASSLRSLVSWYQEHSRSCPHEPRLRALEPRHAFSTAAVWRCDSDHSFVQHLAWPPRDSERHVDDGGGGRDRDDDEEPAAVKADASASSSSRKRRRKDAHKHMEVQCDTMSPVEESAKDAPVWEMEVEQSSLAAATVFREEDVDEEQEEEEEEEDLTPGNDEDGGKTGGVRHDYVTVTVSEPLAKTDEDGALTQSLSGAVPLPLPPPPTSMHMQEQGDLFDPHTLQTVVAGCEIPDQRTALEGSQLIIITGPSYEALASEGIQLNVGGADVEEVTCTVIGGVGYNPVCAAAAEPKLGAAEDEDSMTGLSDKQLLPPAVDDLELSSSRELQRSLSRSKRSRRGPVIEADGMLKMFHCPYEGCSQVYVAISSFQNHVNLVHRKGRTKVCPHPGCGKKFYLSNHLHRHMIIHSGVRDFICETCGKSFKRKNHLEVHRRTHTGETPLQCEICGYQCRQRASLNWHMKKHTPEAHYNFTCDFCDKRFEKLDSVKFHKLKSHPDKQAT
ncbi:unnamed protein product [Ophioblennius macclurei]